MQQDPRAALKALIRRSPWVSAVMQWVFDPAFTPTYVIDRWARRQEGFVLNIGSGSRNLGPRVINLDIEPSAHVHVVNHAPGLPFHDQCMDAALLEYVLEHVEDCEGLLREVTRVVKPGGELVATVPFRQNYHACPQDFWRFTFEGLAALCRRVGLTDVRVEVYGGPMSAWIDATKEFLATLLSFGSPLVFAVLSQALILPFIPLRYLDVLLRKLPVAKYTAFSLQVTARVPGVPRIERPQPSIDEKLQEAIRLPEGYQSETRGGVVWIREVAEAAVAASRRCGVMRRRA